MIHFEEPSRRTADIKHEYVNALIVDQGRQAFIAERPAVYPMQRASDSLVQIPIEMQRRLFALQQHELQIGRRRNQVVRIGRHLEISYDRLDRPPAVTALGQDFSSVAMGKSCSLPHSAQEPS